MDECPHVGEKVWIPERNVTECGDCGEVIAAINTTTA